MKKQLAKFALTAVLGLALTLTLNACEEKGGGIKTVKIGEQVWMAENLNIDLPGSMCYNSEPDNCKKYARVYEWETAMKACPSGWHLPSKNEWDKLKDFADGEPEKLKPVFGHSNSRAEMWWTATESGDDGMAYSYSLVNLLEDDISYVGNSAKFAGYFVRCIQN